MPNEIYHRSNWGNANAEEFGDVYYDHAATNKLYNHSDYYENSNGTDETLRDLSNKASIVLTPTAYSDGSLNTVIPPYAPSYIENVAFVTSEWNLLQEGWSIDETNNKLVAEATWTGSNKRAQYLIPEITVGKTVKFSFDVVVTAGKFHFNGPFSSGSVGYGSPSFINQSGSYSFTFVALSPSVSFRNKSTDFAGEITNIRVEVIEEADFDFSRGSSATRVNEQGLVEDVQILSGELVQNGDFEQIGSELIVNGSFDTDSNWDLSSGISYNSNGYIDFDGTQGFGRAKNTPNTTFVQGKIYKVVYEIKNYVSGTVKFRFQGGTNTIGQQQSGNGVKTQYKVCKDSSNDNFQFFGSPTFIGSIDNVSVKEVGQNWTFGTGWSIANGVAEFNGTTAAISQNIGLITNRKYQITFTVNINQGGIAPVLGGSIQLNTITTSGTHTVQSASGVNPLLYFQPVNFNAQNFQGSIDNVSVVEVTDDTDLPRIDFTDGTGSLLLEPQRTNLFTYSQDASQWGYSGITTPVSQDGSINNPDGVSGANEIIPTSGSALKYFFPNNTYSHTSGDTYSFSVFAKANELKYIQITGNSNAFGSGQYANFDLENGVIGTYAGATSGTTPKIEDYGNGWYRCQFQVNASATTTQNIFLIAIVPNSSASRLQSLNPNGTDSLYVYGFQAELGSYPTSYIVSNSGSATTRSADVANNSGNADLFNDSEGVLYAEILKKQDDNDNFVLISINNSSDNNDHNTVTVGFDNDDDFFIRVKANNVIPFYTNDQTASKDVYYKIALSYKSGDSKIYINGNLITPNFGSLSNTFSFGSTLNNLSFDYDGNGILPFYGNVKCVAVFKEALTDAELENLTSWVSFTQMATDLEYTLE